MEKIKKVGMRTNECMVCGETMYFFDTTEGTKVLCKCGFREHYPKFSVFEKQLKKIEIR